MTDLSSSILASLESYKNARHGGNRYNTPWRNGSNGGTLAVDVDAAYGGGGKWYDHKTDESGNFLDLADRLGIERGNGASYTPPTAFPSLAEYARAHGLPVEVLMNAGYEEVQRHGNVAFAFSTATGMRYRYADPDAAGRKYDSEKGYKRCWFGLLRAVNLARKTQQPLVICNGEISVIAAQHYGVAACCVTGGEKPKLPADLANELAAAYSGPILVAGDCDDQGRKMNDGLRQQLGAMPVDLGGTHGFDLADFCRLHQEKSVEELEKKVKVKEKKKEYTVSLIPRDYGITARELEYKTFDPINWCVDEILPEGACILAGKPKTKKSWMALGIAITCASPNGRALGYYSAAHGDVLYLDLESNQRRMRSRLQAIGAFPERLHIYTQWPRGQDAITAMGEWCDEHPAARLIVVDILAKVRPPKDKHADPYEQDYVFLESVNRFAEDRRLTVIVIHHTRKASADHVMDEISGTTGLTGAVATPWVLSFNPDAQGEQLLHVMGRDVVLDEPIAVRWDATTCQHVFVAQGKEASSSAERRAILDVIPFDTDIPVREIAASVRLPLKSIDNMLRRLIDDGLVSRTGRGRYSRIPSGMSYVDGFDGFDGKMENVETMENATEPFSIDGKCDGKRDGKRDGVDMPQSGNFSSFPSNPSTHTKRYKSGPRPIPGYDDPPNRLLQIETARRLLKQHGTTDELMATDFTTMTDEQLAAWIAAWEAR